MIPEEFCKQFFSNEKSWKQIYQESCEHVLEFRKTVWKEYLESKIETTEEKQERERKEKRKKEMEKKKRTRSERWDIRSFQTGGGRIRQEMEIEIEYRGKRRKKGEKPDPKKIEKKVKGKGKRKTQKKSSE